MQERYQRLKMNMVLQCNFCRASKKSLTSVTGEFLIAILWSFSMIEIAMMKKWLKFVLIYFDILKYDWIIKKREKLSLLPLIN